MLYCYFFRYWTYCESYAQQTLDKICHIPCYIGLNYTVHHVLLNVTAGTCRQVHEYGHIHVFRVYLVIFHAQGL